MTISKVFHAASAAIAGFSIATALTIGAVAQTDSTQVVKKHSPRPWSLGRWLKLGQSDPPSRSERTACGGGAAPVDVSGQRCRHASNGLWHCRMVRLCWWDTPTQVR